MFNSTIFDVVFGLVSVFLAISLFTSALTEAVSSIISLRARTLLGGVQQLLNDPKLNGLALDLYNHALVNPLSDGTTTAGSAPAVKPSYIEPRQFALALIDTTQRAAGQAATLKESIAALFNADPIHVADTLWQRPAVAAQLAKFEPAPFDRDRPELQAQALLRQVEAAGPLLGWSGFASDTRAHGAGVALMLLGWLIAAGAALFGAPFWFDVLQRFVKLRGSGPPPGTAAA
jgi:hypothetical protein